MQRTLISDSLPRIASCCCCAGRMKPSGLGRFKPEQGGSFSSMLESSAEPTGSFMRTLLQSRRDQTRCSRSPRCQRPRFRTTALCRTRWIMHTNSGTASLGRDRLTGGEYPDSGFHIIDSVLSQEECEVILRSLERSPVSRGRAGARHLLADPNVAYLARDTRLITLAAT